MRPALIFWHFVFNDPTVAQVAIDDSKSMMDSGAVDAAFLALAALTSALQQLDVGEVAVAAFGEQARLLRGFGKGPWTDEVASNVTSQFTFAQKSVQTLLMP